MFFRDLQLENFILSCNLQKNIEGLFSLFVKLSFFCKKIDSISFYQAGRDKTKFYLRWNSEKKSRILQDDFLIKILKNNDGFVHKDRELFFILNIKGHLIGVFFIKVKKNFTEKDKKRLLPYLIILKNEIHLHNLYHLVVRDELTGLFNKRSFITEMQNYQSIFKETLFSLAAIDIDRFKHYNDTYGHQVGDYILKRLGNLLKMMEPVENFQAYRFGGEEIMLIFQGIDAEECKKKMERIRKKTQDEDFSTEDWFLKLTLSAGICDSLNSDSVYDLLEKADKALYLSKKNGRNRVTVYKKG